MRLWSACASLALLSCGDHDRLPTPESEKSFQPLVGLEDWQPLAREQDPFVTDEAPPECDTSFWRVEEAQSWLELDTTACGFITLAAGAGFAVEEGQPLAVAVSHFDLDAAAPATAELRLRFEDCDAWEKSIAIPSAANVYEEQFPSPCAIAPGGQVMFHVHNHGQNTYQLRSLKVLR